MQSTLQHKVLPGLIKGRIFCAKAENYYHTNQDIYFYTTIKYIIIPTFGTVFYFWYGTGFASSQFTDKNISMP